MQASLTAARKLSVLPLLWPRSITVHASVYSESTVNDASGLSNVHANLCTALLPGKLPLHGCDLCHSRWWAQSETMYIVATP